MPVWFFPVFILLALLTFIMSPPEVVANWFINRHQLHPQLNELDTDIHVNGKQLARAEKQKVLDAFNHAVFVERYQRLPAFSGTPIVITQKRQVKFSVYVHSDHIDVCREHKKKEVAYRLISKPLQRYLVDTKANTLSTFD